jgi:hypothetical protein
MLSPHPSYPPLEMAEAGMRVVANAFENKDLSRLHENISSFRRFEVGDVAGLVKRVADEWLLDPQAGWRSQAKVPWFFGSQTNIDNVANAVARKLGF